MQTQSPKFSLNDQQKHMILSIIAHGLIGTLLTLISEVFAKIDYGNYTPLITVAFSTITLSLQQYLSGPSQVDLLRDQVAQLQKQTPPAN